jgi:hypothetical protein
MEFFWFLLLWVFAYLVGLCSSAVGIVRFFSRGSVIGCEKDTPFFVWSLLCGLGGFVRSISLFLCLVMIW